MPRVFINFEYGEFSWDDDVIKVGTPNVILLNFQFGSDEDTVLVLLVILFRELMESEGPTYRSPGVSFVTMALLSDSGDNCAALFLRTSNALSK